MPHISIICYCIPSFQTFRLIELPSTILNTRWYTACTRGSALDVSALICDHSDSLRYREMDILSRVSFELLTEDECYAFVFKSKIYAIQSDIRMFDMLKMHSFLIVCWIVFNTFTLYLLVSYLCILLMLMIHFCS